MSYVCENKPHAVKSVKILIFLIKKKIVWM